MLKINELKKYYSGKKVLITGHTGFKGSYMCVLLKYLGAKVYGYSLKPEKGSLYELLSREIKEQNLRSNQKTAGAKQNNVGQNSSSSLNCNSLVEDEIFADIRDAKKLTAFVMKVKPDYVLHMAAQPLVLLGYEEPRYTYEVNVMGTVNLLEAVRSFVNATKDSLGTKHNSGTKQSNVAVKQNDVAVKQKDAVVKQNYVAVKQNDVRASYASPIRTGELCEPQNRKGEFYEPISILNVTTDKVYENKDSSNYAFKEKDKLCGRDPYANSKSCSELVTYAYEKSFFADKKMFRVSTARAGNVIGGGDLNANRIIPDCYRSIKNKKEMLIRNPKSIRPYQFVLEPLILYLNIMALQKKNKKYEGNYNIGPDKKACLTTEVLTKKFFEAWEKVGSHSSPVCVLGSKPSRRMVSASTRINFAFAKHHESKFLRLDNSLIKKVFKYKEIFSMKKTMEYTARVYYEMLTKGNLFESIIEIIETLD